MEIHVLVADIHQSNRTLLKALLSKENVVCDEAVDILAALRYAKTYKYDAIFCSAALVAGTDLQTLQKSLDTPIIVMTNAEEKAHVKLVPNTYCVVKPLTPSRVSETLKEILPAHFEKAAKVSSHK